MSVIVFWEQFKHEINFNFFLCQKSSEIGSNLQNVHHSSQNASLKQRVKKREGKTQIFGFLAGQSGQIFLAGYIWAVRSSHRWQHLWAKVKIMNLL